MRLSMWVLADWLKTAGARADIVQGPRELRNVRLLPSSGVLSRTTVYLDADDSGNVLCSCGRDLIVVPERDIDAVFNSILDCFEFYNDLDARLRDLASAGAEAAEVLDAAGRTLGQFYVVADATYFLHAWGGDPAPMGDSRDFWEVLDNRSMPLSAIMHVNKQQGIRTRGRESYLVDVAPMGTVAAVSNLFEGEDHEGWLVSIGVNPQFTRGYLHIQDALAPIILQCLRSHAIRELRMDRAAVLADLLDSGSGGREMADARLATLGWDRDDPKRIYAIRQYDATKNPNHVVARFLERIDPTLAVADHGGGTLLFADMLLVEETQLEEAMAPILASCGCAVGKSPVFADTGAAPENARAARVAANAADGQHLVVGFDDIKLAYALSVLRTEVAGDVRHAAIERLADYDAIHDARLVETLRVYLACACSATTAAKTLFVHRSTLLYRLERIEEVAGVNLADPDIRFHLDLSLRMQQSSSDGTILKGV